MIEEALSIPFMLRGMTVTWPDGSTAKEWLLKAADHIEATDERYRTVVKELKDFKAHAHGHHDCDYWVDPVLGPGGCANL